MLGTLDSSQMLSFELSRGTKVHAVYVLCYVYVYVLAGKVVCWSSSFWFSFLLNHCYDMIGCWPSHHSSRSCSKPCRLGGIGGAKRVPRHLFCTNNFASSSVELQSVHVCCRLYRSVENFVFLCLCPVSTPSTLASPWKARCLFVRQLMCRVLETQTPKAGDPRHPSDCRRSW